MTSNNWDINFPRIKSQNLSLQGKQIKTQIKILLLELPLLDTTQTSIYFAVNSIFKYNETDRNKNHGILHIVTYHKGVGPHNIKHCDSQESLWIVSAGFLENLSCNRNCGVHWVTDQVDNRIGAALCNPFTKSPDNASIDVEKIIPCHSWLSWNTSRNNDQVHACKSTLKLWLP